jgi:F0F1-type ATP synthase gamma subunit
MKTSIKTINENIIDSKSIKDVFITMQEISSLKLKKMQSNVLKSSSYLKRLGEVFGELSKTDLYSSASKDSLEILLFTLPSFERKFRDQGLLSLSKEVNAASTLDTDYLVFSKFSRDYLVNSIHINTANVIYKDVDSYNGLDGFMRFIADFSFSYRNVTLKYIKYEGIMRQLSETIDFKTALDSFNNSPLDTPLDRLYILEPSKQELYDFFKNELVFSIFEQYYLETDLSNYASKLVTLQSSIDNLDKYLLAQKNEFLISKQREYNKRQLESLSGYTLWN